MNHNKLKIISLNVKGMNKEQKRRKLIKWLHQEHYDIILLQETKCPNQQIANKWIFGQHFQSIWSCSGTASSGSAILIREDLQIPDVRFSEKGGRLTKIEFIWENQRFVIASVYAPATPRERGTFLREMTDFVSIDDNENDENEDNGDEPMYLIGGDWNFVEDLNLDKFGGNPAMGTFGAQQIAEVKLKLNLEDPWRRRNPLAKVFTWCGNTQAGKVRSRLDRFYTTQDLRTWITHQQHNSPVLSDHGSIEITLTKPNQIPRGPGTWILNSSVLQDPGLKCQLKNLLQFYPRVNSLEGWDSLKKEIARICQDWSRKIKRRKDQRKNEVDRQIEEMQGNMKDNWNEHLEDQYSQLQSEAKEIALEKIQGALIRSRIRDRDLGLLPTRSLSSLQKRTEIRAIQALRDKKGELKRDSQDILQIASGFYKTLYSSQLETWVVQEAQKSICRSVNTRIDEECQFELDLPISEEEILEAIQRSGKNRSPGPDGLTSEFYNSFKTLLAPLLKGLFDQIFEEKSLTPSQREALVTLIYKKGDESEIANYRPISLLNLDLKILSKVLSNRLRQVLPMIINQDQKQVKGRTIQENTRFMIDLIFYLQNTRNKGAILLFDQEKAFDRIEWNFMINMLKEFGFGENFLRWIQILYKDPTLKIKINNWIGDEVKVERGVRQGDPLSPLLYTICIEGLACKIRECPELTGISLPGEGMQRIKILLYADDTSVFLPDLGQLEPLKRIFKIYELASGAKMNWSKCEGMLFHIKEPPGNAWQGRWLQDKEVTKYLGIPISKSQSLENLWASVIKNLQDSVNRWPAHLNLLARRTVVNNYLIPKILYILDSIAIPKDSLDKITSLFFRYLWKGKRSGLIRRETCFLPLDQGGLGVVNLDTLRDAMHSLWVVKLIKNRGSSEPWYKLSKWMIKNRAGNAKIGILHLLCKPAVNSYICSPFWLSAMRSWEKVPIQLPTSMSLYEWLEIPLATRCLPLVPLGNALKKTLVNYLDLWHEERWSSRAEIQKEHRREIPENTLDALISRIPPVMNLAQPDDFEPEFLREDILSKLTVRTHPNKPPIVIRNLSLRDLKTILRPCGIPQAIEKWRMQSLDLPTDIWKNVWTVPVPIPWNETYYFLLHQALWTGEKAFQKGWAKIPRHCSLCGEVESVAHLFWDCIRARTLIGDLQQQHNWPEMIQDFLFAPPKHLCLVQRAALRAIWTDRCRCVHGKESFLPTVVRNKFNFNISLFS